MEEESILWTQGADNKGVFSLDGKSVTNRHSLYTELMVDFSKSIITKKWDYQDKDIKVYSNGKKTIVTGYFEEKDDTGRKITYSFFYKGKSIIIATKQLQKLSGAIHYTISPQALNNLNNSLKKKATKVKTICWLFTVASIVLFVSIMSVLIIGSSK